MDNDYSFLIESAVDATVSRSQPAEAGEFLPSPDAPEYDLIRKYVENCTIWVKTVTTKTALLVFNTNAGLERVIPGKWSRDSGGHWFISWVTTDGRKVTLRNTGLAGPASTKGKAAEPEAGVVIWLDLLSRGLDELPETAGEITQLYQSKVPAEAALEFLHGNDKWNKDCKDTAKSIIKELGPITRWNVHHGDKIYNDLRSKGSALSGAGQDRWNPADIILVAKNLKAYNQAMKCEDIANYNQYFADLHGDIIGISLKGSNALHGSAGISSLRNNPVVDDILKSWKPLALTDKDFDRDFGDHLSESGITKVGRLLNALKKKNICKGYNVPAGMKSIRDIVGSWEGLNMLWRRSYPFSLSMINAVKSKSDLNTVIFYGLQYALSRIDMVSAPFWKAIAGKPMVKFDSCPSINDFELIGIRVPLNGSASVVFDISLQEKKYKLQLRAKNGNSPPQFIINPTDKGTAKLVPLSSLGI